MTDIERFELRIRLDATVTITDSVGNATDWLKPGSETGIVWGGMPTPEEVALAYADMTKVTQATLQTVILETHKKLREARDGG